MQLFFSSHYQLVKNVETVVVPGTLNSNSATQFLRLMSMRSRQVIQPHLLQTTLTTTQKFVEKERISMSILMRTKQNHTNLLRTTLLRVIHGQLLAIMTAFVKTSEV